jgi:hypothetical protein
MQANDNKQMINVTSSKNQTTIFNNTHSGNEFHICLFCFFWTKNDTYIDLHRQCSSTLRRLLCLCRLVRLNVSVSTHRRVIYDGYWNSPIRFMSYKPRQSSYVGGLMINQIIFLNCHVHEGLNNTNPMFEIKPLFHWLLPCIPPVMRKNTRHGSSVNQLSCGSTG